MTNQNTAVNSDVLTNQASKYATGYWLHLFGPGPAETRCRIVIDLEQSKLVAAQEWAGLKFEDVRGDRLKDLAESVIEVNEAHTNPNAWAFVATDVLPAWATTQETPAAPAQGTITLHVTLQELKVIQAAVHEYRELIDSPTSADRDAHGDEWADREVGACDAFLKGTIAAATHAAGLASEQSNDGQSKGRILRNQALAMLQQAQVFDGLRPFAVTHSHGYGDSTYVFWAAQTPSKQEAELVLEAEFEPDMGETLTIEDGFTLAEMTGADEAAVLPAQSQSTKAPRVLVVVKGGFANPVSDEGVDVVVFDWDEYKNDPECTAGIPARFADLGKGHGIPIDQSPAT